MALKRLNPLPAISVIRSELADSVETNLGSRCGFSFNWRHAPSRRLAMSSKKYLNIGLLKGQQMRGPSPLEPVTGAAQLKPKCERFWTPPG